MKDFLDVLQELQNTPVPVFLIGGGILFLFIAVGGQFGAKVTTDKAKVRQGYAAIIGILLLLFGVALYTLPLFIPSSSASATGMDITFDTITPVPPTNTIILPTDTPQSTLNWDAVVAETSVSVFQEPKSFQTSVIKLLKGDKVQLIGTTQEQDWVKVRNIQSGLTGWVKTETLELIISLDKLEIIK